MMSPLQKMFTAILVGAAFSFGTATLPRAAAQTGFKPNPHLYNESANPTADIAAAEKAAAPQHKRVLLEFGGNWCGDCQVLDYYYNQQPSAELLAKYYVVVRVDIGHIDKNLDVAQRYHVPIAHGVPALAVLDAQGKVLYAEREKEFEHVSPEELAAFLNRWKS